MTKKISLFGIQLMIIRRDDRAWSGSRDKSPPVLKQFYVAYYCG